MKTLMNKMKNKKGFSLMEMLIVVAIMIILVAVAIPTFSSQLKKANKTADEANLRTARALAMAEYLVNTDLDGTAYFDAVGGVLTEIGDDAPEDYGKYGDHDVIKVEFEPDEEPDVDWVTPSGEDDEEEEASGVTPAA